MDIMTDNGLTARFASGLELDLGEENMKRIDELLIEISKLSNVAKLFLFLKLPGEVDMFKSQQRRDARVDSICVQWVKSHLEPHPNFSLLKKNVYDSYKSFCISSGFGYVSLTDFGKNLRATVKTVHHRRLGRRGEALYAYAGVKFLEEAKPFVVPDLSKDCTETNEQFEHNITNGDDNGSDDDDDDLNDGNDEICDRWDRSVHAAVRNLILEWAEKVIDKNIKFKKYRQLAEHLFNKEFINTNSRDAFILLSDMRLSSSNKVLLPKPPASSNNLNSVSSKADESMSNMQSQTKQKLFSTLTKRDELRQQKKRAKQEDHDPNLEMTDLLLSKSCNGTIKSLNVRSSSAEINTLNAQKTLKGSTGTTKSCTVTKSCLASLAVKRPASAHHQKVILPKIARTQDTTSFVTRPNYDATNSASVSQFLLLSPGSSSQLSSTIAPVVFALLPQQTTLAKNQVTPVKKQQHEFPITKQNGKKINNLVDNNKRDCGQLYNQSNASKCIVHVSQSIEKAPLSLASSSSPSLLISSQSSNKDTHKTSILLPKDDGRPLFSGRALTYNNPPISDDNLPGPHDFNKVFNRSKFIESILNDVASNPFGLGKGQSSTGQNPVSSVPVFHAPVVSTVSSKPAKSKNVPATKSKLSTQTVSMLLSRQKSKNGESFNSQLKLVSDRRPVSQILQDKRDKYNSELVKLVGKLPQNTTQIIQLPALTHLQSTNLLGQINSGNSLLQSGSCEQSASNSLFFSLPSDHDESVKKSQSSSTTAPISYYFKLPARSLTDTKTEESQDSQDIRIEKIVDNMSSASEAFNAVLSEKQNCITGVPVESGKNEVKELINNSYSSSSLVTAPVLRSGKSQLLQLLNEPIIHPDGSVVFQKNSDPSEILSWFESQGTATAGGQTNFNKQQLQILNETNKSMQISLPENLRKHSTDNPTLCSPISFISDKGSDEVFMPYIDNFIENFTFQQLGEAFKSKMSKSELLSSLQKSDKQHIGSFSTSLLKQQQDGRPISASIVHVLPSSIDDNSKMTSRFSRPRSTVTSLAVDESDKVFESGLGVSKDGDRFTPVQMIEKLTPGTTGVKHPQPLIGSALFNDKLGNEPSETSKLLDFNWNAFISTDQVNKKPSIGGFAPYSSTGATQCSESQVRHKPVEPRENDSFIISEDSFNMFLSTFRQRHSSAHEISSSSSGDPWMSNNILQNDSSAKAEAEMEAAFQQDVIESSTNHSLRCHSEPSKYRIPSFFSLENEILMESDGGIEMRDDGKIDDLPARDETLVDMASNNDLDALFEGGYDDGVVNFGNDGYFWNGSGGISDHLISGLSPPKVVPAKPHQQSLTFLDSQKELPFLVDNEERLEGVETLNGDNDESI